jgi:hypothetical protein
VAEQRRDDEGEAGSPGFAQRGIGAAERHHHAEAKGGNPGQDCPKWVEPVWARRRQRRHQSAMVRRHVANAPNLLPLATQQRTWPDLRPGARNPGQAGYQDQPTIYTTYSRVRTSLQPAQDAVVILVYVKQS